ncbi:hypothetical protein Unana1_04884 [Umbelopsis nana]
MVRIALLATLLMLVVLTMAAPIPSKENEVSLEKRSSTYSGRGTWYNPDDGYEGGNQGACGGTIHNTQMIVALNRPQYGNINGKSKYCGRKISITGPHGTATATIRDACPECPRGALDMTQHLFTKVIGNLNIGEAKIKWHFV